LPQFAPISEQGILQRLAWLAQKFRPTLIWINVANVTAGAHCRRRSPFYGWIIGMALVGCGASMPILVLECRS
jgi:hypothetical protein